MVWTGNRYQPSGPKAHRANQLTTTLLRLVTGKKKYNFAKIRSKVMIVMKKLQFGNNTLLHPCWLLINRTIFNPGAQTNAFFNALFTFLL